MRIKELLRIPDTRYSSTEIFKWLWRASRTNRLQAAINACIGMVSVAISLAQVWPPCPPTGHSFQ